MILITHIVKYLNMGVTHFRTIKTKRCAGRNNTNGVVDDPRRGSIAKIFLSENHFYKLIHRQNDFTHGAAAGDCVKSSGKIVQGMYFSDLGR